MNIDEFVRERKRDWEHLDRIAARIGPGQPSSLSREELWDLGRLYTAAVSDLSVLKSSPLASDPHNDLISYLNALVIRVHGTIYGKPAMRWASIRQFVTDGFPRAFRDSQAYVCLAAAIMFTAGLSGFFLGLREPAFIELLVPETIISTVEKGEVWFEGLYGVAPMASSHLMTHNIAVTFLTFAAGMTFGIGTFYLLAYNGLLLGTIAALCYAHHLSLEFWSFVFPHGSVELTAIVIAGGAGLILGHALIDPGPYKRSEFLAVRGKQAIHLVLGCVPLLVIAGLIEAFFSPSPLPPWLKICAGALLFFTLMGVLFLSGVKRKAEPSWKMDVISRQ